MTMEEIVDLARRYAADRIALEELLEEIGELQRKAIKSRYRGLRSQAARTAQSRAELHAAVEQSRDLFDAPRTQTIDGVKFGWRKKIGVVDWDGDDADIIQAIREHLPRSAARLIKTKRSIDKTAVRKLDAEDLARIGVVISGGEDEVVIAVAAGTLDKLVAALAVDALADSAAPREAAS